MTILQTKRCLKQVLVWCRLWWNPQVGFIECRKPIAWCISKGDKKLEQAIDGRHQQLLVKKSLCRCFAKKRVSHKLTAFPMLQDATKWALTEVGESVLETRGPLGTCYTSCVHDCACVRTASRHRCAASPVIHLPTVAPAKELLRPVGEVIAVHRSLLACLFGDVQFCSNRWRSQENIIHQVWLKVWLIPKYESSTAQQCIYFILLGVKSDSEIWLSALPLATMLSGRFRLARTTTCLIYTLYWWQMQRLFGYQGWPPKCMLVTCTLQKEKPG